MTTQEPKASDVAVRVTVSIGIFQAAVLGLAILQYAMVSGDEDGAPFLADGRCDKDSKAGWAYLCANLGVAAALILGCVYALLRRTKALAPAASAPAVYDAPPDYVPPVLVETLSITVQTLEQRRVALEVSGTTSIATLKRMIHERQGVPPANQRLIFNSQPLEDSTTRGCYQSAP